MEGSVTSLYWALTATLDGLDDISIPATYKKFSVDDIDIRTFEASAEKTLSADDFGVTCTGEVTSITDVAFISQGHIFSLSADYIPYTWLAIPRDEFGNGIKESSCTAWVALSGGSHTYVRDDGGGNLLATDGSTVGQIFYRNGALVISHSLLGDQVTIWDAVCFRSLAQITTHEYHCRIEIDEFNHSLNPSAFENLYGEYVADFKHPYLTTIGLYDDEANLIAVAKLAQPMRVSNTIDVNIKVRFDL